MDLELGRRASPHREEEGVVEEEGGEGVQSQTTGQLCRIHLSHHVPQ